MNKKIVIISMVILLALLAGAGVWKWKNKPLQNISAPEEQTQDEQKEEFSSNLDYRENIWSENLDNTDSNNLAWYEVPELEIKFQVTADTKEDLKYFVRENKEIQAKSAFFYLGSIKKFIDTNSKIKRLSIDDYVVSTISKISEEENKKSIKIQKRPWCFDKNIIAHVDENIFCTESPQASLFDSKEQYEKYKKIVENKKFGIFFNTIQPIK